MNIKNSDWALVDGEDATLSEVKRELFDRLSVDRENMRRNRFASPSESAEYLDTARVAEPVSVWRERMALEFGQSVPKNSAA